MSNSSNSKTLQRSDQSQDNSDEYIPSDTTYSKRSNYKRSGPTGERSSDSKSESDFKKSHHASCHRCGNIRRKYIYCERCPQVFCMKCMDKMIEEHGNDCFKNGCPVCKKLCCCSEKSMSCPRKYHCYKKCLTTKKGIKKSVIYQHPSPVSPVSSPQQKSAPVEQVPLKPEPIPSKPVINQTPAQPPAPQQQLFTPFPVLNPAVQPLAYNTQPNSLKRIPSEKGAPFLFSTPSLAYGSFGLLPQRVTPDVAGGPTIQSLQSTSSLRFPSIRMNSEDQFVHPPLSTRDSISGLPNGVIWDPSMCQLHRAPDSVQVMNNGVYDTPTGLQPRLLPLQRANSSQSSTLLKKTSLQSGQSLQRSPYSDSIMRDDINVWGSIQSSLPYTENTSMRMPTPVPLAKQPVSTDINTEVCFDNNDSDNDGVVALPSQFQGVQPNVTVVSSPVLNAAPTPTATPLARSLSTEVAIAKEDTPVLATRVSTDLTPDVSLLKIDSMNYNYRL